RVCLVGTGSSGVQVTPEIAREAAHLYVFQRTATYTMPANNGPLAPEVQRETKDNYDDLRRRQRASVLGVIGFGGALIPTEPPAKRILETPMDERLRIVDELGFRAARAFGDVMVDLEANEAAVELYR